MSRPLLAGHDREAVLSRFAALVESSGRDDCWLWRGARMRVGYGRFRLGGPDRLAHRVAYELFVGPVPEGLCVLHRCDNPPCVNPAHLFLGDRGDNARDRERKGRGGHPKRWGERSPHAKLREAEVIEIRRLAGGGTQEMVAGRFGVSQRTVSDIVKRRTWKQLA